MKTLDQATPAELEVELLKRAISKAETEICRIGQVLTHMISKQTRRRNELARQQAKGQS